ncbi:MAG: GNAT family N-acetyltransferase [Vicinamibacteraceae bacterium]
MSEPAPAPRTEQRDGYTASSDPARLDVDAIHTFLTACYWSTGIPRETVARALAHSLGFGLYAPDGAQVGFVRAVTDHATFAYLCDVYVLDAHRGRGLGEWLVGFALDDPALRNLRRLILATRDAHGLYAKFGFTAPKWANAYMDIVRPDIYLAPVEPRQGAE